MSTSPDRLPRSGDPGPPVPQRPGDPALLGTGLRHPLRRGPDGLERLSGREKIEQSILAILGTGRGERVMRPDFGCDLSSLAFAPNNDATAGLARFHVMDGLARWEPRIDVVDVTVTNDLGAHRLVIAVTYRIRATRDVHTLAHPFPLERI